MNELTAQRALWVMALALTAQARATTFVAPSAIPPGLPAMPSTQPAIGAAPKAQASTQDATRSLARLIDAVLRQGPESALPAHLSMVLGVTADERPAAVKQAMLRNGSRVRTFNVSTANHDDVVLIDYDETRRTSRAFLMSPSGVLRKAVSFTTGGPPRERTSAEADGDFKKEIDFWMKGGRGTQR